MSGRFDDQAVLITGAAGGIGEALAERFASEGAKLILIDRPGSAVKTLAQSFGERALAIEADVASEADTLAALARAGDWARRIDVAVLAAAVQGRIAPMAEQTLADFDHVMGINARGMFIWLTRLLQQMKQQGGGAMVALSSIAGLRAVPGVCPYVASKHAVNGLVKSAALEGASAGVRVNAVNPGPIDTPMLAAVSRDYGDPEAVRARTLATIPLNRYGQPSEVAALVAFLCSSEAAWISGVCYPIDGGRAASGG